MGRKKKELSRSEKLSIAQKKAWETRRAKKLTPIEQEVLKGANVYDKPTQLANVTKYPLVPEQAYEVPLQERYDQLLKENIELRKRNRELDERFRIIRSINNGIKGSTTAIERLTDDF